MITSASAEVSATDWLRIDGRGAPCDPQPIGCVACKVTPWRHGTRDLERQVTLPSRPDDVWELLTRPDELAAWLGDEVVLDPTPGAAGTVRRARRHPARASWSKTSRRAAGSPGGGGRRAMTQRRRAAWRSPCPHRPMAPLVRVVEQSAPTPARRGPGQRRRGVVAPAAPPRGPAAGRRRHPGVTLPPDAEARAGAVFEALADPTRSGRAPRRRRARPGHGHGARRPAPRDPPGDRQAPRGAARGRSGDTGARRPGDPLLGQHRADGCGEPLAGVPPARRGISASSGSPPGSAERHQPREGMAPPGEN